MIWWLRSCHYEYGEYQRVVHQCQQSREAENLMRRNSYEQLKKEQDILECCSAGILHMWVAWQSLIANSKLRDSFIRILLKKKNPYIFFLLVVYTLSSNFPQDLLYLWKFTGRATHFLGRVGCLYYMYS